MGQWLELAGWEIRRWCDQWIEAYQIEDGLPKADQPQAKSLDLRTAFDALVGYLATNAHQMGLQFAGDRLALPGELYLVDRMDLARYVAFYVRTHGGHDRPVVRLRIKPRVGVVEIRLPVVAPEVAQAFGTEAEAIKIGQFRSRMNLGVEHLAEVGPRLLELVQSGALKLPPKVIV